MNRNKQYKKPFRKEHTNKRKDDQDYNVVLMNLQDYMLANDIMEKSIKHIKITNKYTNDRKTSNEKIKKPADKNNGMVYPKYKDSLFWCYYILSNSLDDYTIMDISKKYFETEKQAKIDLVTLVREKKDEIKKLKLKRTDIENELVNESTISINTFLAICDLKDIPVLIVKNKIYYELGDTSESSSTNIIIYDVNEDKYGIDMDNTAEKIAKHRDTLWKVENISKPIRGISFYKIGDLQDICKRVGIDTEIQLDTKTKNKTKPQLYEELVQKLS